jgi:hypothetical protein
MMRCGTRSLPLLAVAAVRDLGARLVACPFSQLASARLQNRLNKQSQAAPFTTHPTCPQVGDLAAFALEQRSPRVVLGRAGGGLVVYDMKLGKIASMVRALQPYTRPQRLVSPSTCRPAWSHAGCPGRLPGAKDAHRLSKPVSCVAQRRCPAPTKRKHPPPLMQAETGGRGVAALAGPTSRGLLVLASTEGQLSLLDPRSAFRAEHSLTAHTGGFAAVDVKGDLVATSGYNTRMGRLSLETFAKARLGWVVGLMRPYSYPCSSTIADSCC